MFGVIRELFGVILANVRSGSGEGVTIFLLSGIWLFAGCQSSQRAEGVAKRLVRSSSSRWLGVV